MSEIEKFLKEKWAENEQRIAETEAKRKKAAEEAEREREKEQARERRRAQIKRLKKFEFQGGHIILCFVGATLIGVSMGYIGSPPEGDGAAFMNYVGVGIVGGITFLLVLPWALIKIVEHAQKKDGKGAVTLGGLLILLLVVVLLILPFFQCAGPRGQMAPRSGPEHGQLPLQAGEHLIPHSGPHRLSARQGNTIFTLSSPDQVVRVNMPQYRWSMKVYQTGNLLVRRHGQEEFTLLAPADPLPGAQTNIVWLEFKLSDSSEPVKVTIETTRINK